MATHCTHSASTRHQQPSPTEHSCCNGINFAIASATTTSGFTRSTSSQCSIDFQPHESPSSVTNQAMPVIKSVEAIRVLALRKVMENYRAQKELWPVVVSVGVPMAAPCFTAYYDIGFKEKDVDMEVCLPIADDAVVPDKLPEGVRALHLPAQPRVAAITHFGPFTQLHGTYAQFMKWAAAEKLRPLGPFREVYLSMDPEDASEESFVTEIQLIVE